MKFDYDCETQKHTCLNCNSSNVKVEIEKDLADREVEIYNDDNELIGYKMSSSDGQSLTCLDCGNFEVG